MTTSNQISVTRALAERKALEGQIIRASMQPFVGVQKGTDSSSNTVLCHPGKSPALALRTFQANFDSVDSLIKRRDALTDAIIKSNAETEVIINGVKMKVAVAIERKKSIPVERQLVNNVTDQLRAANSQIEAGERAMQLRMDTAVAAILGKDKASITEDKRKAIVDPIEASDKHALIQHTDLSAWAAKKTEEINGFINEVDLILSESNAKTLVTIGEAETASPELVEAVKLQAGIDPAA